MHDHTKSAAFNRAQIAYDNMTPPEDDGREDYIVDKVDEMMATGECELVPFFTITSGILGFVPGFDADGSEAICAADSLECELLQIVLACLNGEHEKAQKLAYYFDGYLRDAARKLVEAAMDKESGE